MRVAPTPRHLPLRPGDLLAKLLRRADSDRDGRITAADLRVTAGRRAEVCVPLGPGLELRVRGAERLSLLAGLLSDKLRVDDESSLVGVHELVQGRVDAFLYLVDRSWDSLTRRADTAAEMIAGAWRGILKPAGNVPHLYVPASDRRAAARLRKQLGPRPKAKLIRVPRRPSARFFQHCERFPGIGYLPHPYLVPGGHFHEMYGWDSYFMASGALLTERLELALGIAENLIYEIQHYGRIPNSNRSYQLSRTHPPLLTRLSFALFEALLNRGDRRARPFLVRAARAAEAELARVWMAAPRATATGLSRYCDEAGGRVPEVPQAFFEDKPRDPEYYRHDRALRESGWDLTYRFGQEAHLHAPICLNSLLFQYEIDLSRMWKIIEGPRSGRAARWAAAAETRRRRIDALCWDPGRALYFDFNFARKQRSSYECLATFYPLWVGAASEQQAEGVSRSVGKFLAKGGLTTSTPHSRATGGPAPFQWDYPVGWAPLQIVAVQGLRRYGFEAIADEIAYRWLWMILRIAGEGNGFLLEKYDVVRRSADVLSEYANQGSDRGPYVDRDPDHSHGFGWTNASIPILLEGLPGEIRRALDHARRPQTLWPKGKP